MRPKQAVGIFSLDQIAAGWLRQSRQAGRSLAKCETAMQTAITLHVGNAGVG